MGVSTINGRAGLRHGFSLFVSFTPTSPAFSLRFKVLDEKGRARAGEGGEAGGISGLRCCFRVYVFGSSGHLYACAWDKRLR